MIRGGTNGRAMKPEEPEEDGMTGRGTRGAFEELEVAGLTGLIEGVREREAGSAGVVLGCGGMTVLRATGRGMGSERPVDFFLLLTGFLPHCDS